MPEKKRINFEKALEELEQLVDQMESGELSLEQSLKAFEKGVKLTRDCQTALQEAEQRVTQVLADGDDWLEKPFQESDD